MIDKIKNMYENGFSVRKISKDLSLSEDSVLDIINSNKLSFVKEQFSEDKIDHIISLYNAGVSAKQLGIKYSIDKRRVQKWVSKDNLRDKSSAHRANSLNEDIFDQLDNKIKFYWLGFLFSASYNVKSSNTIIVTSGNSEKLKKLASYINIDDGKIKSGKKPTLKIYSKKLCSRFSELGYSAASDLRLFDWLSDNTVSFVKGACDGTGEYSSTLDKMIIKSNVTFCNQLKDFINRKYEESCVVEGNRIEINKFNKIDNWLSGGGAKKKFNDLKKEEMLLKRRHGKYDEIVNINDTNLTNHYIATLDKDEREALIEPLFNHFRNLGWLYPDDREQDLKKSWNNLVKFKPDLNKNVLDNNSSLSTNLCYYFCHNFFNTTERGALGMVEIFNNDAKLRRLIGNRLGLDWYGTTNKETFTISFKMLIKGMRSMRMINGTSIFKPSIAKYLYMKYSSVGDTVFDYSCGWGGRLLGAMSCGRKYIGSDPLTVPELKNMVDYFNFRDVTLINDGSENVMLGEDLVDFCFSSPPYYDQEYYSAEETQAYNKGEEYFYNVYWRGTLENCKRMLKPGKWFGLNVKNYPRMLEMAIEVFGEVVEEVKLKTTRNHLTKNAGAEKFESVYMFRNNK